jgi:hypothetical protein
MVENQKFGCIECLKPFCAALYYPMLERPICVTCKGKNLTPKSKVQRTIQSVRSV